MFGERAKNHLASEYVLYLNGVMIYWNLKRCGQNIPLSQVD